MLHLTDFTHEPPFKHDALKPEASVLTIATHPGKVNSNRKTTLIRRYAVVPK